MKLFVLLLLISCSHQQLIKDTKVTGDCAHLSNEIEKPVIKHLGDFAKQCTLGTTSLLITTVGAATDLVFVLLTNPVTKLTACVAGSYEQPLYYNVYYPNPICDSVAEDTIVPGLGQAAFDETKALRCPNLDYVSEGLRKISECYLERNQKGKALEQLKAISANKEIVLCISEDERISLQAAITNLSD